MPDPALHDTGPFAPCPAPFNLAAYVLAASARTPGKVALEVLSAPGTVAERWRYADLAEAVTRTAGGLAARGIGRGDRVLIRIGNSSTVPDGVLRRQRPRSGAGADLGGADGARDRRGHRLGRAAPRLPRAGPRPAGGAGRGGDRAGRGRRPPPARARGDRDDGARRSGLHGDDLGQRRRPEGGAPRPARGLGAADDVGGLVRARPGRPHAACRGLQLDLHPRRRAHRPAGGGGDGADLHRAGRPPRLAGPRRRTRGDDLRRGAGGLSPDARRSRPGDRLRQRAPRAQRRRGAARAGAGGVERGHRPGDPRGARHVRDLDLRLGLAVAAGTAGHRRLSAAGAAGGDPARGRGGAGGARRGGSPRRVAARSRPDARLLAAAGGDGGRLPRRVVRHRRPGAHGRGRVDRLSRPRRRPDERRRLPGQPRRGRGGAPRPPRRRRGGGGGHAGGLGRHGHRRLLRSARRPARRGRSRRALRGAAGALQVPADLPGDRGAAAHAPPARSPGGGCARR